MVACCSIDQSEGLVNLFDDGPLPEVFLINTCLRYQVNLIIAKPSAIRLINASQAPSKWAYIFGQLNIITTAFLYALIFCVRILKQSTIRRQNVLNKFMQNEMSDLFYRFVLKKQLAQAVELAALVTNSGVYGWLGVKRKIRLMVVAMNEEALTCC